MKEYEVSFYSDTGNRDTNEDAVGVFENGTNKCFVLCDGLGGHGMGDEASALVKDTFGNRFSGVKDIGSFLPETFAAAQDILMAEQQARGAKQKMKTTAVACVTDGKKLYFGHVGDSRLYVFFKNKVLTRTLDHSIPQMLAIANEIDESEIRNHPERNYVLRVLGIDWEEPMYEIRKPIPLRKCQAVLLCSDGFWELIDESEMCRALEDSSTARDWLDMMVKAVKTNGTEKNMDNNSAIAVRMLKKQ